MPYNSHKLITVIKSRYHTSQVSLKLINLPSRYSVSDAGVFYYDEKILFPSEHKRNNQLIYKYIEEGEAKDDDTLGPDYRISKREEHFQWDGDKFVKLTLPK